MSLPEGQAPNTPSLDTTSEGVVYRDQIGEAVGCLVATWTGIAIFSPPQMDEIVSELQAGGFYPTDYSQRSSVATSSRGRQGQLHRHGKGQLIVHKTTIGRGTANFYWPVADTWEFPYDEDFTDRSAAVPFDPDTVIVFPSQSWHQFNTDPHQERESVFTHFLPRE